ncbi:MAG: FMN-binding protein [Psychrilyobacter sp.]|nr:FMN-binding protein [Psychrilyobacter sp.]
MKKFLILVMSLTFAIISLTGATKLMTSPILKGSGVGYHGDIMVEVIKDGGTITGINILSHSETPEIFNVVFGEISNSVVKAQSVEVDTVAGATASSNGILEAINQALEG